MAEFHPTASRTLSGLLDGVRGADDLDLLDDVRAGVVALRRAEAVQAVRLVGLQERAEAAHNNVQAGTDEVGLLLGISSRAADYAVGTAISICLRPTVWQGWYDGRIDRAKAQKIVRVLHEVPDPLREHLETEAIAYGQLHTLAMLHRKLIRMTCDEDPHHKQRREALDRRGAGIIAGAHGMCDIWIHTSAEHGEQFITALTALANDQHCPDPYQQGQHRSLEQRRADALDGFLDIHAPLDIHVQVTIPADMLIGVETKGANLNGSPITHALAVQLAWSPDARWTRLVTDPLTGVLLDPGTTEYRIPTRLRTSIRTRDQRCRFYDCTRPAEYTDTDHVIPHRQSHTTNADALICLCRHHHRSKTFGAWKIHTTSTYATDTTWISPLGTTRHTKPPNLNHGE